MISVYGSTIDNNVGLRQANKIEKYCKLIQWGRRNPIQFAEVAFNIKLLDYQKYIISQTWTSQFAVWVCSRNAGKSFIGAVYVMLRALLFPKINICFLAPVAKQANDTFSKIENIVKKNISSLEGLTDFYAGEVSKTNSNSDGFIHSAKGYNYTLFNGSTVMTIVGTEKTSVGVRSNLNFYDEAGKIDIGFFGNTVPFCTQNKDFVTGNKADLEILPRDIPNQVILASSAEDVNTYLWDCYRNYGIKMLEGIPGYFCADISCDFPLHPKLDGIEYPPLLTQKKIDDDMKNNPMRATREYYNIFDQIGGSDSMLKRFSITKNEHDYLPLFQSAGPEHHYVICFDPASTNDNSIALVGEEWKDSKDHMWHGKIINIYNILDIFPDGTKRPKRFQDQLFDLRHLMLAFNGQQPEYENIRFYVDIGAGGGGRTYSESLWEDWKDKYGHSHHGIIDLEDEISAQNQIKYMKAIPEVCHMIEPKKWRQKLFESLVSVVESDLIEFPPSLPKMGVMEIDGKEYILSDEEKASFIEMDLMKEEVVNFVKIKKEGLIYYTLPPNKIKTMHDDRCYCLALFGFRIDQLNRNEKLGGEQDLDYSVVYSRSKILEKHESTSYNNLYGQNNKRHNSPFGGLRNPFRR